MKTITMIMAMAGLAIATPSIVSAEQSQSASSNLESSKATKSGLAGDLLKLENKLNVKFHDGESKFRSAANEKESKFCTSVDVRENPQAYVARVYAPMNDELKLNVSFDNGVLHISSNDKAAGSFKESIAIPNLVDAGKMKIENKEGIVVITLPKATEPTAAVSTTPQVATEPKTEDWDTQIIREMHRIQARIDQLTQNLLSRASDPQLFIQLPLFGSTVNLENEKDQYVVHFYLPVTGLANAKTELNGNQLTLTAAEDSKTETTGKTGSNTEYTSGEYTQMITLPGPVQANRMKIDRKAGTVTVTLPKA